MDGYSKEHRRGQRTFPHIEFCSHLTSYFALPDTGFRRWRPALSNSLHSFVCAGASYLDDVGSSMTPTVNGKPSPWSRVNGAKEMAPFID